MSVQHVMWARNVGPITYRSGNSWTEDYHSLYWPRKNKGQNMAAVLTVNFSCWFLKLKKIRLFFFFPPCDQNELMWGNKIIVVQSIEAVLPYLTGVCKSKHAFLCIWCHLMNIKMHYTLSKWRKLYTRTRQTQTQERKTEEIIIGLSMLFIDMYWPQQLCALVIYF